jgi:hypothetical protein
MNNCKCGGRAKLVGNFLEGYKVECQKCFKHTRSSDKVGAIKAWQRRKKNQTINKIRELND